MPMDDAGIANEAEEPKPKGQRQTRNVTITRHFVNSLRELQNGVTRQFFAKECDLSIKSWERWESETEKSPRTNVRAAILLKVLKRIVEKHKKEPHEIGLDENTCQIMKRMGLPSVTNKEPNPHERSQNETLIIEGFLKDGQVPLDVMKRLYDASQQAGINAFVRVNITIIEVNSNPSGSTT